MSIMLNKRLQVPVVLLFVVLWVAVLFGFVLLVVYWIPELVVYIYNTIIMGLASIEYLHWISHLSVPFNFLTWIMAIILLILSGVYKFEYAKRATTTTKTVKKKLSIRFTK